MTDDDVREELTRVLGVLAKIHSIVHCGDRERYPLGIEWYQSAIEHVRRYVAEVIPGDCADKSE